MNTGRGKGGSRKLHLSLVPVSYRMQLKYLSVQFVVYIIWTTQTNWSRSHSCILGDDDEQEEDDYTEKLVDESRMWCRLDRASLIASLKFLGFLPRPLSSMMQ